MRFKDVIRVIPFCFLGSCVWLKPITPPKPVSYTSPEYKNYLRVCAKGCTALAQLTEESDGLLGCLQSRGQDNMTCAEVCAYQIRGGRMLDPDCWTRLKRCEDFEEQCNFGDTFP